MIDMYIFPFFVGFFSTKDEKYNFSQQLYTPNELLIAVYNFYLLRMRPTGVVSKKAIDWWRMLLSIAL